MSKMTSAVANKMLKKLNEDKDYWCQKEREGCTYVAAADEEPVIPNYDYAKVAREIAAIDDRIVRIKHAINVNNVMNAVMVNEREMTVDEILVRMAQLNRRKLVLDTMRKREDKTRINSGMYSSRKTAPEYEYVNYDIETVKREFECIDAEISDMQIALDRYNQTFEFEVED